VHPMRPQTNKPTHRDSCELVASGKGQGQHTQEEVPLGQVSKTGRKGNTPQGRGSFGAGALQRQNKTHPGRGPGP